MQKMRQGIFASFFKPNFDGEKEIALNSKLILQIETALIITTQKRRKSTQSCAATLQIHQRTVRI